jgi:hypothetical protein
MGVSQNEVKGWPEEDSRRNDLLTGEQMTHRRRAFSQSISGKIGTS